VEFRGTQCRAHSVFNPMQQPLRDIGLSRSTTRTQTGPSLIDCVVTMCSKDGALCAVYTLSASLSRCHSESHTKGELLMCVHTPHTKGELLMCVHTPWYNWLLYCEPINTPTRAERGGEDDSKPHSPGVARAQAPHHHAHSTPRPGILAVSAVRGHLICLEPAEILRGRLRFS
jgi:hypothetical protein